MNQQRKLVILIIIAAVSLLIALVLTAVASNPLGSQFK